MKWIDRLWPAEVMISVVSFMSLELFRKQEKNSTNSLISLLQAPREDPRNSSLISLNANGFRIRNDGRN